MAWFAKLLLSSAASNIGSILSPAASLLVPANASGKGTEAGQNTCVPAIHMGDPEKKPWLPGMSQHVKGLSLSLSGSSLSLPLSINLPFM